jgi:thiol-disulfide isomerase/thioredoxin
MTAIVVKNNFSDLLSISNGEHEDALIVLELSGCGACKRTLEELEKMKKAHPGLHVVVINTSNMNKITALLQKRRVLKEVQDAIKEAKAFPTIIGLKAEPLSDKEFKLRVKVRTGYLDSLGLVDFLELRKKKKSKLAKRFQTTLRKLKSRSSSRGRTLRLSTPREPEYAFLF